MSADVGDGVAVSVGDGVGVSVGDGVSGSAVYRMFGGEREPAGLADNHEQVETSAPSSVTASLCSKCVDERVSTFVDPYVERRTSWRSNIG